MKLICWLLRPILALTIMLVVLIVSASGVGHLRHGELLLFLSDDIERLETIYLMDLTHRIALPLIQLEPNASYALSPDGLWFAFTVPPGANYQLCLLNMQTGEVSIVKETDFRIVEIVWSPNSEMLAYVAAGDGLKIEVIDRNGNYLRSGSSDFDEFVPTWSPDNVSLSFAGNSQMADIYTMRFDGSDLRILEHNSTTVDAFPSWSPDGQSLAYWSSDFTNYRFSLVVLRDDMSVPIYAVWRPSGRPQWSPDGTQIAFAYNGEVYVLNADGTQPRNLSQRLQEDRDPIWSLDGSQMFFESRENEWQIYAVHLDGTNLRCITCDLVPNAANPALVP